MAVPAARYLVCFEKSEPDPAPEREAPDPIVVYQAPVVEDDSAHRLQEAYCRGKEEGLLGARAAFEKEVAEMRHAFAAEMQAARSQWADEIAGKLAEQIPAAFHDVEVRIAASVSRILKPVLLAAVRDEVITSLAASLIKLRSGEGGPLIAVSGPQAILDKLRERVTEFGMAITFSPNDGIEVMAIVDQTVLDSQIQAWSSMLETKFE